MAAREVGELTSAIVAAFRSSDPSDRKSQISERVLRIQLDLLPFVSWLEINSSADKVALVKQRLLELESAVECAGLDIPEYRGGSVSRMTEASAGAKRTALLQSFTHFFERFLIDWAAAIEKQEQRNAPRQRDASGEEDARFTKRQLSDAEKRILSLCRKRSLPGKVIAEKLKLSYDHIRHVLARLKKEKRLRNDADGYKTVR